MGLEKYVTAQMYCNLVDRDSTGVPIIHRYPIRYLGLSPLADRVPHREVRRVSPTFAILRFAEAGSFVPFDKDGGYRSGRA